MTIWLLHRWREAEPLPLYFRSHRIVFFRENAHVAIIAADSKRSFSVAWAVMKNCRLAMCPNGRERDPSGCEASCLTPEIPSFRRWYRGCNVNHIVIALSSIALGSFVFARCGGYEEALDFTRADHRIVQSTILISFFAAPEAYTRGRLSDGYIALHPACKKWPKRENNECEKYEKNHRFMRMRTRT